MIADTRIDLQKKELEAFLTEWVRRGKITGYTRYAQAIDKWFSLISNGRPLTTYEPDTEEDKASIKKFTDIIVSSHVDIRVLEQLRDLYVEISNRYVERSKRNSAFWDKLSKELAKSINQFKVHSTIGSGFATYIPLSNDPNVQLDGASKDPNGVRLPGISDTIQHEPSNIILTTYPAHNPNGGVTVQNPEFSNATQNIRKLFRGSGIEQRIWTTEIPHIVIDNITHPGVVWEIELEYQGSITFSSLEIKLRGKYPTTLCSVYTKNLDSDAWALVTESDGNWDHVVGTDAIVVDNFPRTTARKIKLRLCQENYEIRNQDKSKYMMDGQRKEDLSWLRGDQCFGLLESNAYDDELTFLETGMKREDLPVGQFLYTIGLARIKFSYNSYAPNANGDIWSHSQEENVGLNLPSQPIEIVTISPDQKTPEISTVEWWVEDITRRFQIPILPQDTTRVREPAKFVDPYIIQLTYPIEATTVPDVYLNGTLQTLANTPREINSTQFQLTGVAANRSDNYVIEYEIAVGQMVMCYVFVNDTTVTNTISGSNTDANSVYLSKADADSWIVTNGHTNVVHSVPVMARMDEWYYWFNNGEQVYNLGNLTISIPGVYVAPEL